MTEPPAVPSIRRGYYEDLFKEVEAKECDDCGARPGQQCWDWSEIYPGPVRVERVVPHRERFEA